MKAAIGAGLSGLTTRGRSFLAAAIAATISAFALGERDLLRVAVLLAALPLLAVVAVVRARYTVTAARQLEPVRVAIGGASQVTIRLANTSRVPTGTLMMSETLPYQLGGDPRLVVDRLGGHQANKVCYSVRGEVRGRYPIGPLAVRLSDPFGLCEVTRTFPGTSTLTVLPAVTELPPVRLTGEFQGNGHSRARSVAVHGEDDIATREYRYGDDLRRVHWRSTARVGALMVRREEQPWDSRATLVLDTRASAHRGEGSDSSFEWAVSAAASIAMHLRQAGYRLRLIDETGSDLGLADAENDDVLERLAGVEPTARDADLVRLTADLRNRGDAGVVIGLFGLLSAAEADALARLHAGGPSCAMLLLDLESWGGPGLVDERAATLVQGGWRVSVAGRGVSVAALWPALAHRPQAFALRAALAESALAGGLGRPSPNPPGPGPLNGGLTP